MFIPLLTDRQVRRQPVVTETLILLNVLVYFVGVAGEFFGWIDFQRLVSAGAFRGQDFSIVQLITYQFMHSPASVLHLGFNMLFLWVFGRPVEDRLGRLSFLGFYLIGGAVAGIAHSQVSQAPVIGASGSVAAVTGAFLALFPRSRMKVLIFVFIMTIPSLWVIAFFFLLDVLRQAGDLLGATESRVAYMAHIAGYVYGFALAFVLLWLKIVKHDDSDVFFLFRQWRRRAAFRAASRHHAAGMWESASADTGERLKKKKKRREGWQRKPADDDQDKPDHAAEDDEEAEAPTDAVVTARAAIQRLLADHQHSEAAARYRELLKDEENATLPEDRQLDVANQLYKESDYHTAARAYELFLRAYPVSTRAHEVRLMLGIIYARHMQKPMRARELIQAAKDKLINPKQAELAQKLLAELGT